MRDRALGTTIRLKFTTTDSNGAPVAPSAAFTNADFRIYKDGSATEKTTTNGITVTSPFDSVVGRHLIEIDTSNSTGDAGFWASGSAYTVELNTAKTVNSQAVSGLEIGSFSIELQTADVRKFGGTAGTFTSGRPEANTTHWAGTTVTGMPMPTYTQPTGFLAATFPTTVASTTNITSASGIVLAAQTHTGATIPTVSTVTNGVTVTTNNDKTGYSLASGGLASVTAWTVNITGNVSGSVGSVSGAVGSVTGNVGGSVASIASGGITSSSFATDSITATALASSAVSEIQSGLATLANQVIMIDGIGYLLAQETGSAMSPQTSAPVYATAFNGNTYTVTHAGVDATGVRGTATRAKT